MKVVLAVFFHLLCLSAHAGDWCKPPAPDEQYKYYQGLSTPSESKSLALEEALEKGRIQAVRDNFGTSYSVYRKAIETDKNVSLNFEHDEYSGVVYLKNFDLFDQEFHEVHNKYEACVVLRYKKSAIKEELDRLKGLTPDTMKSSVLSLGNNPDNKGVLRLQTLPVGAKVTINGESFGHTPVVIEQVPLGDIEVSLELSGYEEIKQTLTYTYSEEKSFFFNLKPQTRMLSIKTNLYGAEVKINGIVVGKTPLYDLEFNSTNKLMLEITHPEAHSYFTQLDLSKTTQNDFDFTMIAYKAPTEEKKKTEEVEPKKEEPKESSPPFEFPDLEFRKSFLVGFGKGGLEADGNYLDSKSIVTTMTFNFTLQFSFYDTLLIRGNYILITDPGTENNFYDSMYSRPMLDDVSGRELSYDVLLKYGYFFFGWGKGNQNLKIKVIDSKDNKFTLNDKSSVDSFKIGTNILFGGGLYFEASYNQKVNQFRYLNHEDNGWTLLLGADF